MTHNLVCGYLIHHIANGVEAVVHRLDIFPLTTSSDLVLHAVGDQEEEEIATLRLLGNILEHIDSVTADGLHNRSELIPENNQAVSDTFRFNCMFNLSKPLTDVLCCKRNAHGLVESLFQLHIGLDIIAFQKRNDSFRSWGNVLQVLVLIDSILRVLHVLLDILNSTFEVGFDHDIGMAGSIEGLLNLTLQGQGEAGEIICTLDTLDNDREEAFILAEIIHLSTEAGVFYLVEIEVDIFVLVAQQMPDNRAGV